MTHSDIVGQIQGLSLRMPSEPSLWLLRLLLLYRVQFLGDGLQTQGATAVHGGVIISFLLFLLRCHPSRFWYQFWKLHLDISRLRLEIMLDQQA